MDRNVLRRGGLLLLLLFAFGLRLSGLTAQSLWRDEVDALRFATAPPLSLIQSFARPGWNGPLYYVLLRFWLAVTGSTEFAMRYFSLGFGVLSVALVDHLGRRWCAPVVGTVAALLMASSPYMVWYAQEAKMYTLLTTLAATTLLMYRHALTGVDWRPWAAVILLTWITASVHVLGALIIPVMAALLLVWWPTSHSLRRLAGLALAVSLLPVIAALPWILPYLLRGVDIGHRFTPLVGMMTTMLYAFSRGIIGASGAVTMALALFALLATFTVWPGTALLSWFRSIAIDRSTCPHLASVPSSVLAPWFWLLVPILGLYAITLRVPMFVDRYLIWIGPAFYLLVALGLQAIERNSRIVAAICLAAMIVINIWGVWEQSITPLKSDFRAAAAYVQEHRGPDELILFHISYVRWTFEYYYGDSTPATDGLVTDDRTETADVDAAMKQRVAGYDAVWLILSEPQMWDPRGLTMAWLEANATPQMRRDFTRVSVIKYQISQKMS